MSSAAPEPPPGWRALAPGQAGYPVLLGAIADPPALVLRGDLDPRAASVAIIGARRCTPYGEEVAYQLAFELAAAGVTVVSGLARGIDAAAHRGALDAGGRTVAVMGTGPDAVYPPEHRGLADRVAASGALVTQFPGGTRPLRRNFPIRNATISGLSVGVVVVEARQKSGAMLTASSAGNQGRVVMAVPGSVRNPASRGCHDLLRDGARLVTGAREVLAEIDAEPLLRLLVPEADRPGPARRRGDARDAVIAVLATGCLSLDEITERVPAPSTKVVTAVARLRLDGEIRLAGGLYGLVGSHHSGNRAPPG